MASVSEWEPTPASGNRPGRCLVVAALAGPFQDLERWVELTVPVGVGTAVLCHDGVVPLREAGVGRLGSASLNVGAAGGDLLAEGGGGKLGAVLGGQDDDLGVGTVGFG